MHNNINNNINNNIDNDEIDLMSFTKILWKNRIKIISFSVLIVIISIVISLFLTPQYESYSKWLPNKKSNNGSSKLSGLAVLAGINVGGNSDNESYYPELLSSPTFLKKIFIKKFNTLENKNVTILEFLEIKKDSIKPNADYIPVNLVLEDIQLSFLNNSITYSPSATSLSLTISTPDPILSYELNMYILKLLEEYNKIEKASQAHKEKQFIEERFNEFKLALSKAENTYKLFRERNLNINSPSLMLKQQRLMREVEINNQLVIEFRKQLELAKVEEVKETPEFKIIQEPTIPLYKSKPKKKLIVALSAMIGFIFSCAITLLVHWWQENGKRIKEELNS